MSFSITGLVASGLIDSETDTSINTCGDGEDICEFVFKITQNSTLANWSDVLIGIPLAILGLLVLALGIRWVLRKAIDRVVKRAEDPATSKLGMASERANPMAAARRAQRAETMGSLFKSIVTGVVVAVFGTMMLSEIGVDIAPIIASAGIIGIALGFGAQSLVKDFLSGIFMILEDQFGVGDIVDVGEAIGTVEAVSLRVTRLRDINGTVWYVPNGEIMRVGNQSQNWSRTVLDVGVGYHEDIARVRKVLEEIAHAMWEDEDFEGQVIEEPSVWGVQELAADAVTMRVVLKTTPGSQWAVAREMRQRIKARFDHEGIEIPFAQRVVWHRQEPSAGSTTDGVTTGAE
ncbi:mechanosensitive ion channel family protein [Nocardioides sp.]|uniref:mechanosensitive ion channel family protein n=1 Tax=Nocardioides sp. TaxID=35761 RepID=UPI002B2647B1|nr:mechanosensitive ion channel family protein [Nocardioides sp.]